MKPELQFLSLSAVGAWLVRWRHKPKRAMAEKEAAGLTATENSGLAKCGSINGRALGDS